LGDDPRSLDELTPPPPSLCVAEDKDRAVAASCGVEETEGLTVYSVSAVYDAEGGMKMEKIPEEAFVK
jgi:hypothetical protein